ncbi:SDR family oxidoreductase [Tenggerimyces flavus]|uniref:SDR family oxidoreductase n=1 Tax=Tenggerimyces flavus TaxID=1708749 RepID=A0ABV7YCN2_9ACTN|nr:SDR family oxidoreductase [Tenggerimyces flavus]MBM7787058.1 nucleoside-diphosphate-sugar epimerase [Tenggerimyces flavus]
MRIAIAGAHGQIGLRLGRLLAARGDSVVGLVRNPDHVPDLAEAGVEGVVLDLEQPVMDPLAEAIEECDAVVFAAGAGPGSGAARKDTVDRGAAVLLAESAGLSGISRYLLVSSIGVDSVRDGAVPSGVDEVFLAYLRAKLAAEEALLKEKLDLTILRPGGLTNDAGTGRVTLAPNVDRGQVTRDDVAAVLVALLDEPRTAGLVLGLTGGDVPIKEAVAAVCG